MTRRRRAGGEPGAGRQQATWGEVFGKSMRKPLMVGVGLAVFQQITGINAIIYYADKIFDAAGFTTIAGQTAATTWAIGGVNVLATLIAVAFVDRLGRKPLLLAGLVGMGVSPPSWASPSSAWRRRRRVPGDEAGR